MGKTSIGETGFYRSGDLITIRTFNEISATLDCLGTLEGLPFLPEMLMYCGRRFLVRRPINKLIQEGRRGQRRIKDVVQLEGVTCDGMAHRGCQRSCYLLWKTAWIKPAEDRQECSLTDTAVLSNAKWYSSLSLLTGGKVCQATELSKATKPLLLLDPRRYCWDIISGTYTPKEYISYITKGFCRHLAIPQARGLSKKRHRPPISFPQGSLNLVPGETVEVKSAAEIRESLDSSSRCRGLYFMPGMWGFCGRRFRVLRRVDKMMSEISGEMHRLHGTVILEGVTCDGKAQGGCQRGCYVFWKETWLHRFVK